MSEPNSKQSFKDYIKRKLGYPLVDINVSDEQMDDRIDEALAFYRDYHNDGTTKDYLRHRLTEEDIQNQYITVSDSIISIVQVFPLTAQAYSSSENLFNLNYQIAQNDLYSLSSISIVPLVVAMRQLEQLSFFFARYPTIRFNRHTDRLYLDLNWQSQVKAGDMIVAECYRVVDPNEYSNVWKDMWLRKYTTELVKQQWGQNLIKFNGVQLAGGITLNGQKIYDDASKEREKLEEEMINKYSLPVNFFIG